MTRTELDVVVGEDGVDAEDGGDVLRGEAFAGGALIKDSTLVEEQQAVAVLPCHVEVMDNEEDGLVLLDVDLTQEVENFELVGDIKVGDGLVEEQDRGLLSQRTGNHDTLQFTAAHLVGLGKTEVPGVGLFHALLHYLPVGFGLVLQTMLVGVATHEDGFEGGEFEVGMRVLTDESHALRQLTGGILEDVGVV